MSPVGVHHENSLESLTGALVQANDRLCGLLALITTTPPPSLSSESLIDLILDKAAPILDLDYVRVSGDETYTWGRLNPNRSHGEWCEPAVLPDGAEIQIAFFRGHSRFDAADRRLLAAVAKLITNAIATAHVHLRAVQRAVETATRASHSADALVS